MKTIRNARTLGVIAAMLIVSLPTASANHHPAHNSTCDPYAVVDEVVCTGVRHPVTEAIIDLYWDIGTIAGQFSSKILKYACDVVDALIGPWLRADATSIVYCPWQ